MGVIVGAVVDAGGMDVCVGTKVAVKGNTVCVNGSVNNGAAV